MIEDWVGLAGGGSKTQYLLQSKVLMEKKLSQYLLVIHMPVLLFYCGRSKKCIGGKNNKGSGH